MSWVTILIKVYQMLVKPLIQVLNQFRKCLGGEYGIKI